MIGYGAVAIALLVTLAATVCWFRKQGSPGSARLLYGVSVGLIVAAAAYLLYILLGNRFDYAYVFSYSSRDLPLAYKLSAFWAGQEGSFLLWLLFHALFGLMLLRKSGTAAPVMAVYSLIQAVLLGLLLVKSPFMLLAEPRLDGVGLNPLLQDPWMVIHPPILFLGYAALAVPFSYALGALLRGRHQEWLQVATAWTLLAVSCLGAGMFIGGFWAYKVLGWGGYWAWDPVENSSLVPWLAAGALLHLLAMARVRVGAVKHAYAGAICSFILVLYGTFLTRSGVLSDFSTHSFADEGIGGLLGLTVLAAAFIAFALLIFKWPAMPAGELYAALASREFIVALTALMLAFLGVLVFAGMSTPLITTAFGSPKSVSAAFYNQTALPVALAAGAALAVGPLMKWGGGIYGKGRQYWWLGLFAALGLGIAVWLRLHQPLLIVTLCLAVTAAAVNIYAMFAKRLSKAAACSHTGAALMLVGIIASGAAGQSVTVSLTEGQPQEVFGQQLRYAGTATDQTGTSRYTIFQIGEDDRVVQALTKLNKAGLPAAREPGIYRSVVADLYLAPQVKVMENAGRELTLVKGQPLIEEGVSLNFVSFAMAGLDGSAEVRVQAVIEVTVDGQTQQVRPELADKRGQIVGSTVAAFDRYELHITGIRPGEGKVTIEFHDTKATAGIDRLEVEISRKPLINLVWLGAVLITAGTGWAGIAKLTGCIRENNGV